MVFVQISPEVSAFFARANLGPRVNGSFGVKELVYGKTRSRIIEERLPITETLQATQEPLNSALVFTHSEDPFYGIVTMATLSRLLVLHAFYENMYHRKKPFRLSASHDMRVFLEGIMSEKILSDARQMEEEYSEDKFITRQIEQAVARLLDNLRDPSNTDTQAGVIVDESGETVGELFNPNCFRHGDFIELISSTKLRQIQVSDESQIELDAQQDEIDLAVAYKNKVRAEANRTRRTVF